MGGISDDAIRERAYQIWEREGRPYGRDFEHWVRAQIELTVESGDGNSTRGSKRAKRSAGPARARTAATRSAPAKASKPAAARKRRNK